MLHVSTLYGMKSRKPLVQLTYDAPGQEFNIVMSVATARNHAQDVLECAESAVGDAFLFEFFKEKMHLKDEQAAAVLVDFRKWRAEKRV